MAERGEEVHGIPVAEACLALHARVALTPAAQGCYVGLGLGRIDEYKALRVYPSLITLPASPSPRDIGLVLPVSQNAFFEGGPTPRR